MGCGKESETWRAKAAVLEAELGAVEGRRAASIAQVSLTPACLTSVSLATASAALPVLTSVSLTWSVV